MSKPTYDYYREIFRRQEMPFAFVDLDLFDQNIREILPRAGSKLIRVASKSVRCRALLERVFKANDTFQGIMCFTVPEALFLVENGFSDLLPGYPCVDQNQIEKVARKCVDGKPITLMVDSAEQVQFINEIGATFNTSIPICMDIDMSYDLPGLHFGVWRSSIRKVEDAIQLAEKIHSYKNVKLEGVMGYEAQVAGIGDNVPGKLVMNSIISTLKNQSIPRIAKRRKEIVNRLKEMGFELRFVNGGGTGSLESTREEEAVTEVTVGSGFYSSGLFDNYKIFKHHPAAGFAVQIVRSPKPGMYTALGGGYIASGAVGPDKQPKPYLPEGIKLDANEGTGEVQTPFTYMGTDPIGLGDPVFFRHSKAGELCERFNTLFLVKGGEIVDEVPTYRGEGYSFL